MSAQFAHLPIDKSTSIYINPFKVDKNDKYKFANQPAYLTKKKPKVYKYFDGYLFQITLNEDNLFITRDIAEFQKSIHFDAFITVYGRNDEKLSVMECRRERYRALESDVRDVNRGRTIGANFDFPAFENFAYIELNIAITGICGNHIYQSNIIREMRRMKGIFTNIETNNGIVRVHKNALSDNCRYFKQLFSIKKRSYRVDCEFMDLIELIYVLPPFRRRITTGITFGALHRLSELFKCPYIGDLCANYFNQLQRFAPLTASLVAYEANVSPESQYYSKKGEAIFGAYDVQRALKKEQPMFDKFCEQWHQMNIDHPILPEQECCQDERCR